MKVSEIMKENLITIDKDQSVHEALIKLEKGSFSKLPVIDDGRLVGIVTYTDLLRVLGSSRQKPTPAHIHVSNAMSTNLKVLNSDHDASDAARMMLQHEVSALPVLDGDRLIGLVTKADLVSLVKDDKTKIRQLMTEPITISAAENIVRARELIFEKNLSMIPVVDAGNLIGIVTEDILVKRLDLLRKQITKHLKSVIQKVLVEDIMSQDTTSVSPDQTVSEAVCLLIKKRRTSLPVVENGRLVGILSKTDLLKLLE